METATVGKVLVPANVENLFDLKAVEEGRLPEDQVRRIEVLDARVDTGATYLALPKRLIDQLGLYKVRSATARTAQECVVRSLQPGEADRPGTRLRHRGLRGRR